MRLKSFVFLLLLCWPPLLAGQFTQVSGTVKDPNNLPYANGTITPSLVISGSPRFISDGFYTPPNQPSSLDSKGSFVLNLADLNQLTPSGGTWSFHICSAAGTVQPGSPITAGPVCFDVPGFTIITGPAVDISTQLSAAAPKLTTVSGGGVTPASGGGSPSSAYTIFPSTSPTCAAGSYSPTGTTFCAQNNITGAIDSSGSDAAAVIQAAVTARATVGGRFYFKIGTYNLNSFTLESATGCSNFQGSGSPLAFAIGFPSNTNLATSVQWIMEGETNSVWPGESGTTTVNTNGVIFNVTTAGVGSVTANSVLAAFWARPITNCTFVAANSSNDISFNNLAVRFPNNQRGNEIGIGLYFASDSNYNNVLADFATPYASIASGAAPNSGTYSLIGITSTVSGGANVQRFDRTYVTGYYIGYDWQSEHIVSNTSTSIYCVFPAFIGRSGGAIYHPIALQHFIDQENLNGIQLGPQMQPGTLVNMLGLDMELGQSGWFARQTGNMEESTPGNSAGIITYTIVGQGQGLIHTNGLFTIGGQKFTQLDATQVHLPVFPPGSDSFFRSGGSSITGAAWQTIGSAGTINSCGGVNANSFTSLTVGAAALCYYQVNGSIGDQFSEATLNTLDANGATIAVRASNSATTYYDYVCLGPAGGRQVRSRIAGVLTTLASTASNCTVGNTLELIVVGSNLFAYYAGTLDLVASDANITSGFPALIVGGTGDSWINWNGGALPQRDNARSLFGAPMISPHYQTQTNCAAVGSAANPSVVACATASAGSFSCATNASNGTCVINTSAVTTASQIFIQEDGSLGARLGVTCNASNGNPTAVPIASRVAGASFTIDPGTITTNPECFSYWILN